MGLEVSLAWTTAFQSRVTLHKKRLISVQSATEDVRPKILTAL